MKRLLLFCLMAGLAACDNASEVKINVDSTVKKVEDPKVVDTFKSKTETISDTMKNKGGRLKDSIETKGGRLADKIEKKIRERKQDSLRQ